MENQPPSTSPTQAAAAQIITNRKRSGSSGGGILSKLPNFLRSSDSRSSLKESRHIDIADDALIRPPRALAPISQQSVQQQIKTRRRKGSLRKVALLGRGAQRERSPLNINTNNNTAAAPGGPPEVIVTSGPITDTLVASPVSPMDSALGLGISDITPRPSMDGYAHRADVADRPPPPKLDPVAQLPSPTISSYASTTDEEDILSLKTRSASPLRPTLSSVSSGSESYFSKALRAPSVSLQRRRSIKHAKSPLSLQGLTASSLPPSDSEYDYSETEWWGWVILIVTWTVFVIGMGSCLGVWSWAWDVGTTPYAPPEFEDDPTLPIVGYYPALMILTCIMAWVWVVTAWVGMKYFRHAKITGD
ncbi:hypothetical protein PG997_013739 [Apiospora hydei]|uniref:PIG-P domain-containing protein n=1 Tax=Apiospora hydei TaxID=1337664 RepID=A0ABR1V6Z9_9PEZI